MRRRPSSGLRQSSSLCTCRFASPTDFRCDADPDVLADYVLALFKYDTSEAELIAMLNEQLRDFLEDSA